MTVLFGLCVSAFCVGLVMLYADAVGRLNVQAMVGLAWLTVAWTILVGVVFSALESRR